MQKEPISVTLSKDNLLWLRGQSILEKHRSVSETLDRLILAARERAGQPRREIRSVVGIGRTSPDDPDLLGADAELRKLFAASLERTAAALDRDLREERPPAKRRRRR